MLIHLVDGHNDGNLGGLGVVDGLHRLGHDAVVCGHHQNGNVRTHSAAGTHGSEGRMTRSIQEGNGIPIDLDGISANVLGDAASLAGYHVGLPHSVQQAGLAVVHVAPHHHHGTPGLELLGGVHMIVNESLFNGNGDLPLDLAAQLRGHVFGGVKVNGLVDGGHDAVAQEGLDDLRRRLFHAAGQLCHHNFIGDFHSERRLFDDFHTQAAHFFLLFGAGLAALEFPALFIALALAANFLLAAGNILDPLGNQGIHPVVKPGRVDLHGRGIHHTALPLALRLCGLGVGLRCGSGSRRWGLGSCGAGLDRGSGFGGGKDLLQRADLMILGDVVKDSVQLLVGEHLAVALRLVEILADDLRHLFRRHAEISGHFSDSILDKTHNSAPPCDFLPCFLTAGPRPGDCFGAAGFACRLDWAAGLPGPAFG